LRLTPKDSRVAMPKEQRFWNAIALVFFLACCALSVVLIARCADLSIAALTAFDAAMMGLGTFRLAHLLTYDKIFELVRTLFMDGSGPRARKAARGWRRLVYEFLECLWCTGMWSALIVVTAYLLGTWGRFAVIVLAVAGIGSFLQVISNALAAATERR
jgi:hypothetical protein